MNKSIYHLEKWENQQLKSLLESDFVEPPEGERIHIQKEILEQLLFGTVIMDTPTGQVLVKYIVWSGDFLSKIDLSEISFDDVLWDINVEDDDNYYSENEIYEINLSNTNAHIDFSKSL